MAGVMRRSRPVRLSVPAAALLVLLAACGPGLSVGSAPEASGSSAPPSTGAVSPPTDVPTGAPTATASAGRPAGPAGTRCATGQLRVTVVPGDSAAGHLGLRVVFTNTGSGSCTMFGYPGVSFVTGASGAQVNDAAQRAGGPSVLVAVASGGSAHADLLLTQVGNYPVAACRPVSVAGFRVYPPDETGAVFVGSVQQVCSVRGTGVAQVYPVQSGP